MNALGNAVAKYRAWYCLDCGKCAAVCPVTHWEARAHASPRLLIEKAMQGEIQPLMDDPLFWSCLTCNRCSALCPSDVHFSEFLRAARELARQESRFGVCTHSELLQTLGRMMTNPNLKQNRLGWLTDDLQVSGDSDTVYFVGCLPYTDPIFKGLGAEGVEIARAALKILNHLGIKPQVLADERCCGHDQLWQGDLDTFRTLARLNLESLKARGAQRIVTACPECARTLKLDYPQYLGAQGLEVFHLTELLAEKGWNVSNIIPTGARVTYHDPCRLGRHLGVYDAPRTVIANLGFELVEMRRHAESSLCCGTTCWSNCGQVSRNIQAERLEEARGTGAQLLVTACPKCQIHFKCAQNGGGESIPIRDLTTLIAERLSEKTGHAAKQEASIGD